MNDFEKFFDKLKLEMSQQMSKQTNDIISQIDDKINPIILELKELKLENHHLKEKIENLEKHKRRNNIIIHRMKETEKTNLDLMEIMREKIKKELDISVSEKDIDNIYRIGKVNQGSEKIRPILITFLNGWIKNKIMMNKNKFKDIYVSDDYPKEVIAKRKELQTRLLEERKKGNFAVIKYDKLVIKEGNNGKEKRKRETSSSPKTQTQPRKQYVTSKANRINAFDVMRSRSNSLSSFSQTTEQNL